jgi:hypothetical protein
MITACLRVTLCAALAAATAGAQSPTPPRPLPAVNARALTDVVITRTPDPSAAAVRALADEYWAGYVERYPEVATYQGVATPRPTTG